MLFSAPLAILLAALVPTIYSAPLDSRGPTTAHTGDGTFYDPALGACGKTNYSHDLIVAVGHGIFDTYPGANKENPNKNPICGKKLRASYGGKSVVVTVEDRCVGCANGDLDFTRAGFGKLASLEKGRITGMKWEWV